MPEREMRLGPIQTNKCCYLNRHLTDRQANAHRKLTIDAVMYLEDLEIGDIPGGIGGNAGKPGRVLKSLVLK